VKSLLFLYALDHFVHQSTTVFVEGAVSSFSMLSASAKIPQLHKTFLSKLQHLVLHLWQKSCWNCGVNASLVELWKKIISTFQLWRMYRAIFWCLYICHVSEIIKLLNLKFHKNYFVKNVSQYDLCLKNYCCDVLCLPVLQLMKKNLIRKDNTSVLTLKEHSVILISASANGKKKKKWVDIIRKKKFQTR
jgi:hypothetical protein